MRPSVALMATIAVAAATGLAISVAQRPSAASHPVRTSPFIVAPTPPPNQPSAAYGFTVASDPTTSRVVLFGGAGDLGAVDSTWLWDGAAWSRAHPAASPSARAGAAAAFDPQIGKVLLFGGTLDSGTGTSDTWAWDGSTWAEVDTGSDGPPRTGAGSAMAWDPSLGEMVLVTPPLRGPGGGATWIWKGTHWVRALAGDIGTNYYGVHIAFDPVSRALIAEGCCETQPGAPVGGQSSTWRWNGAKWSALSTSVHPKDVSGLEMDPSLRALVLSSCDLAGAVGPTMWVWNGQDWTAGPYGCPPIAPEAEVIDPADSQFLVLGASIGGVGGSPQAVEVWTPRGTQWLQLGVGLASG